MMILKRNYGLTQVKHHQVNELTAKLSVSSLLYLHSISIPHTLIFSLKLKWLCNFVFVITGESNNIPIICFIMMSSTNTHFMYSYQTLFHAPVRANVLFQECPILFLPLLPSFHFPPSFFSILLFPSSSPSSLFISPPSLLLPLLLSQSIYLKCG